jgi:hypothetical protein
MGRRAAPLKNDALETEPVHCVLGRSDVYVVLVGSKNQENLG